MATQRQKLAVKKILENPGSISKAMRDVGYSKNTAKNPSDLTNSKGFKQLCDEVGLTEDFILKALKEDIDLKPQNRKPELELGAKLRGMLVDRQDVTTGGEKIGIVFLPQK